MDGSALQHVTIVFAPELVAEGEDVDFRGGTVQQRHAQIKQQRLLRFLELLQGDGRIVRRGR